MQSGSVCICHGDAPWRYSIFHRTIASSAVLENLRRQSEEHHFHPDSADPVDEPFVLHRHDLGLHLQLLPNQEVLGSKSSGKMHQFSSHHFSVCHLQCHLQFRYRRPPSPRDLAAANAYQKKDWGISSIHGGFIVGTTTTTTTAFYPSPLDSPQNRQFGKDG